MNTAFLLTRLKYPLLVKQTPHPLIDAIILVMY